MSKKPYLRDYRTIESLNNIKKIAKLLIEEIQDRRPGIAEEHFETWLKEIESNIESIREIAYKD
ncbi:hypothetical protein ES705_18161 [subsurface metagenome]|jgi:hypothetical protein|nr:MAG: hypothetical protein ES695_00370 [Candidatus Atribacteria bacterium 1244-E10-H5-B2]